jgi:MtfA peptidase
MPQDTTIYWDGNKPLPALIDSLPFEQRQITLRQIHNKIENQKFSESDTSPYIVVGIFGVFFVLIILYTKKLNKTEKERRLNTYNTYSMLPKIAISNPPLSFRGTQLNFSFLEISGILTKHSTYFNSLNLRQKEKFIQRVKKFITQKIFVIHDEKGLKEMPVLISAAAIQLTFGLEKYLLPNFIYIHVFPEEFICIHPTIRFLEGNVSGNSINLSWKHFISGFQHNDGGQNVGLHEMAHAYYYQFFETGQQADENFVAAFPAFNNLGNKIFEQESKHGFNLYSNYALRNFQEFWAESIEIFFERPTELKSKYPDLYLCICNLLNQYPIE